MTAITKNVGRKTIAILIALAMIVAMTPMTAQKAYADTPLTGDDIQALITAANQGDEIILDAGTYVLTKPLVIYKRIKLIGNPDAPGNVVLKASSGWTEDPTIYTYNLTDNRTANPLIVITNSVNNTNGGVTIDGITVDGDGQGVALRGNTNAGITGIYADGGLTLKNSIITNVSNGVYEYGVNYGYGLITHGSGNVSLNNVKITNFNRTAIWAQSSGVLKIKDSEITRGLIYDSNVSVASSAGNGIVIANGNNSVDIDGLTITGANYNGPDIDPDSYGTAIASLVSVDITAKGLIVSESNVAIELEPASSVELENSILNVVPTSGNGGIEAGRSFVLSNTTVTIDGNPLDDSPNYFEFPVGSGSYIPTPNTAGGIQHRIDVASPGDVITLEAGTYELTESLVIDKAITLIGDPSVPGNVVLKASPLWTAAPTNYIFRSNFKANPLVAVTHDGVTIKGIKIDGDGQAAALDKPGTNGIVGLYTDSNLILEDSIITNLSFSNSGNGPQQGYGLVSTGTGNVSLSNVEISNYNKNGIWAESNTGSLNITNSRILQGIIPNVNEAATNGIVVAGTGTININGLTISGNQYIGPQPVNAAGITVNVIGGTINATGLTITNADADIAYYYSLDGTFHATAVIKVDDVILEESPNYVEYPVGEGQYIPNDHTGALVQKLIDTAPDGGIVNIPEGNYVLDHAIFINHNITLKGNGNVTFTAKEGLTAGIPNFLIAPNISPGNGGHRYLISVYNGFGSPYTEAAPSASLDNVNIIGINFVISEDLAFRPTPDPYSYPSYIIGAINILGGTHANINDVVVNGGKAAVVITNSTAVIDNLTVGGPINWYAVNVDGARSTLRLTNFNYDGGDKASIIKPEHDPIAIVNGVSIEQNLLDGAGNYSVAAVAEAAAEAAGLVATQLATAQTNAKTELAGYKNAADYNATEKVVLAGAKADGTTAIEAATSTAEVNAALFAAKLAIEKIKTSAQIASEEAGIKGSLEPVDDKVFSSAVVPTISGISKVGKKLTASVGTWAPEATLSYQWYAGGIKIDGATTNTLTLGVALLGKTITVAVTGSKNGYVTTTKASVSTTAITTGFVKTPKPVIKGTAKVGKKLTVKVGTWSPKAKYTYKWYANGKVIKGATKATYKIAKKYKGKKITVKVTAKKANYVTVAKTSAKTKKVK